MEVGGAVSRKQLSCVIWQARCDESRLPTHCYRQNLLSFVTALPPRPSHTYPFLWFGAYRSILGFCHVVWLIRLVNSHRLLFLGSFPCIHRGLKTGMIYHFLIKGQMVEITIMAIWMGIIGRLLSAFRKSIFCCTHLILHQMIFLVELGDLCSHDLSPIVLATSVHLQRDGKVSQNQFTFSFCLLVFDLQVPWWYCSDWRWNGCKQFARLGRYNSKISVTHRY